MTDATRAATYGSMHTLIPRRLSEFEDKSDTSSIDDGLNSDHAIDVDDGASVAPPSTPGMKSAGARLATVVASAGMKFVTQTGAAGLGELGGLAVQAGCNALIGTSGGTVVAVVVGGLVVALAGIFAGVRAAELIADGTGAGTWAQATIALAPAVVPLATALGIGVTSGSAAVVATSLGEAAARSVSCFVRDGSNAVFRGTLPEMRVLDEKGRPIDAKGYRHYIAAPTAFFPFLPNVGVGIAAQISKTLRADGESTLSSGLQGAGISALAKGGYAFFNELATGLGATLAGFDVALSPARPGAVLDNLGSWEAARGTLSVAADDTAVRQTLLGFSGSLLDGLEQGGVIADPALRVATRSVMASAGEARGVLVRLGRDARATGADAASARITATAADEQTRELESVAEALAPVHEEEPA